MDVLHFLLKQGTAIAGTLLINGGMLFLLVSLHVSVPAFPADLSKTEVTVFQFKKEKKPSSPQLQSPSPAIPAKKKVARKKIRKPASPPRRNPEPKALPAPLSLPGVRLEKLPFVEVEDCTVLSTSATATDSFQGESGSSDSSPRNPNEVDRNPVRIHSVKPRYPLFARRRMIEGWVILKFVVDENGRVSEAVVLDWHGHKTFRACAKEAVKQWRFRPAEKDQKPVPCYCVQKISFHFTNR